MAKKLHWTQTPEGRERARKNLLHAAKIRSRQLKGLRNGKATPILPENEISYAFGHVSAWLEVYADAIGQPRSDVAFRVADLLHRKARR